MNKSKLLKIGVLLLVSVITLAFSYDDEYVEMATNKDTGWSTLTLKREYSKKRIKVKYFAAKDYDGTKVPQRYKKWSYGKNVIAYTSAAYMNSADMTVPDGLCVDNGRIINRNVADFDALVVVYATGGIVVADIDEGITVGGSRKFKVKNSRDKMEFLEWCENNNATVFQTHLLAYKNKLRVATNASTTKRERRFLAVGKDNYGDIQYVIINTKKYMSFYQGAKQALENLQKLSGGMDVIFMINLDTGMQDVYRVNNSKGEEYFEQSSKGKVYPYTGSNNVSVNEAVNLLVFYWQ